MEEPPELTAARILIGIESGDLDSIKADGMIKILYDLKPVLVLPADPVPQISRTVSNLVRITSGDNSVATLQAENDDEAEAIASTLAELFRFAE